jgi:hypothetical protein
MIKLWSYIHNCMKEWEILFQFSMVLVMLTNKKYRKLLKVECNFGLQLNVILIIILKIMIDNNK